MATKADLKKVKQHAMDLLASLKELQEDKEFGKLWIPGPEKMKDTAGIIVDSFIPRLEWFINRLNRLIEKAPGAKRGRKKKEE